MKPSLLLALVMLGAGCGDNTYGGLTGTWFDQFADGGAVLGLTLKSDGTFRYESMRLTSPSTANDQVETGAFMLEGNTRIAITVHEWTCPGPNPGASFVYELNGDSLMLNDDIAGVNIALTRDTSGVVSSFALTLGCNQAGGNFVPEPLAPVSN